MSGQVEMGHVETVSPPSPCCHLLPELVDNVLVFFSALFCVFVCLLCFCINFLQRCLIYRMLDYLPLTEVMLWSLHF